MCVCMCVLLHLAENATSWLVGFGEKEKGSLGGGGVGLVWLRLVWIFFGDSGVSSVRAGMQRGNEGGRRK